MKILENCATCLCRETDGKSRDCSNEVVIFPLKCDDYQPDYDRIAELKAEDLTNEEVGNAEFRYNELLKAARAVITESCNCMNPEFCNYKSTPPCTEKMHDLCEIAYRNNYGNNY